MTRFAVVGADIFDGERRHVGSALLIDDGRVVDILPPEALPADAEVMQLEGGLLAPGFIDAQVNGGGGVMLNDDPAPGAMAAIARAHRRFGTTALLPTLITDTASASAAAIAAAAVAVSVQPGVIGLHLEGPHLAPARKGAHVPELMRPLSEADVDQYIAAREAIGVLMVTMAVEQAPPPLIRRLSDAGVIVSLGHSNAGYDEAMRAIQAGARCVTHLFNAMSGLGHRAPGLVGAALDSPSVWCGVISDGYHVHPAALSAAIRAKQAPGRCFLVTDAMSTVGATGDGFLLNGRQARRRDGRLELDDGTLAGSDIDMASSVRFAVERLAVPVDEALRMASLYPAMALGTDDMRGRIAPGLEADLVWLDRSLKVLGTFVFGDFEPAT